ncbi:MAG: hypothetical protein ACK4N5_14310 [Myxococcales bacterium]
MDRRSLALVMGTTVLAAATPAFLDGANRIGVLVGVFTAAVSAAVTFYFLGRALKQSFQKALAFVVNGFLAKMALVAGGLMLTRFVGGELLAFAASFFSLFLAHQMIEIAAVLRSARKERLENNA